MSEKKDCCHIDITINSKGDVNIYTCPPAPTPPRDAPCDRGPEPVCPGACVPLAIGTKPKQSQRRKLDKLLAQNHGIPSAFAGAFVHLTRRFLGNRPPANALEHSAFDRLGALSPDLRRVLGCALDQFDDLDPAERAQLFETQAFGDVTTPVDIATLAGAVSSEAGQRAALLTFGDPGCLIEEPGRIRVFDPGGTSQVLVKGSPDSSLPRWSRDGRWLAFTRSGLFAPRNLFVVDVTSGQVRQATQFSRGDEGISSDDWLPDSRHLAVSFVPPDSGGEHDLGVLDVTTGTLSRLTFNLGGQAFQRVNVSADGSRLVATSYFHRHSLWKVPLGSDPEENGRLAVRAIDDMHDPSFIVVSRDGGVLVFAGTSTGARNVWTMPLDARALPRQVTTIAGTGIQHPAISPDGESLAFAARINGTSDIWLQQMDGGNLAQLTSDGADSWPTWSPDGQTIVFSRLRDGRAETWQVAAAGGAPEKLWEGLFRGDWIRRPDGAGTWLVTSFPSGIRLYDYERRSVVWEKPIRHALAMPVFSPDGRSISVSARDQDAREAIWILDAATGEGKPAVRLPERFRVEFRASWVDGGKSLIVNRIDETSHVVLFDRFWGSGAKQ